MIEFSQQALIGLMSHLFFIAVTWWALQALNFDKFIRSGRVVQARVLYILLTIAIAHLASSFFLEYFFWSKELPSLF
ncbi:DUF1146 domain-containing protein [Bacillus mangrovi]|uniref:DUF1146 domain-containing protein n=1 Tax=Metabacillus mangrovi TaxID=1491830 RepID=A0A7X2S689_9BACI|nr:DUF1146 family protein [Metabacillus mangrovi]MTH53996.1 DUF1146 domain-containing protein [Metabacillus mangrovi]